MKGLMIAFTLFFFLNPTSYAAFEVKKFENPQHEQRYKKLVDELRCLISTASYTVTFLPSPV